MNVFHRPALAGSIFCVAWALTGCASVVDNQFEQIVLRELPTLVGPAQSYRVKANGLELSGERLQSIEVDGLRIARPGAPVIDQATVVLRDVQFDRAQKRVNSIGAADAVVRVLPGDISTFLQSRAALLEVTTQFEGTRGLAGLAISARPSIAGLPLPAGVRLQIRGTLQSDGPRLNMNIASLSAGSFELGLLANAAVAAAINPIFDLSKLPAPTQITSISIDGPALVIQANGISALPDKSAAQVR